MTDIAIIILQKNEALHIRRCLEKLRPLEPRQVFVVDCLSTDGSDKIAQEMGATVVCHEWPGLYAVQFNWALDNCPIQAKWVLRMDADEYLYPETIRELIQLLTDPNLPDDVSAFSLPLSRTFLGHPVKRGVGKVVLTRVFRYGIGRCEERKMDEHITLSSGRTVALQHGFVDDNLNGIDWWTQKHLGYAAREAADLMDQANGATAQHLTGQAARKRRAKGIYARLPLFWRALAYFCYRYFLRGGFLEGKAGFQWHFFQGLWYRMLVDAKIWKLRQELKRKDRA